MRNETTGLIFGYRSVFPRRWTVCRFNPPQRCSLEDRYAPKLASPLRAITCARGC